MPSALLKSVMLRSSSVIIRQRYFLHKLTLQDTGTITKGLHVCDEGQMSKLSTASAMKSTNSLSCPLKGKMCRIGEGVVG